MAAHGMEYPALFGQVGSAHPAVSLPGFPSWIPVKINPVLAEPRTYVHCAERQEIQYDLETAGKDTR